MRKDKFGTCFSKFLIGGCGISFLGTNVVNANPPKDHEKEEQKEQIGSNTSETEKNLNINKTEESGWFNYLISAIRDFFSRIFFAIEDFKDLNKLASGVLDNLNTLFDALRLNVGFTDLKKEFESDDVLNPAKVFLISQKLKYSCESVSEFDFEKIFETSSAKEIEDLFSKVYSSFEGMILACSKICENYKHVSSKFLENFKKSLEESKTHLKKIETKYNEKHNEWYFSSGNVSLEENRKMNDRTRNCAEKLYKIFESYFGCRVNKYMRGNDICFHGINEGNSGDFLESHIQEAGCLNAVNDFMRDLKFDHLKESCKNEEEFSTVMNDIEKLLKGGLEGTHLRRRKNRVDFRGAHNVLLRKWRGLLEYYTKVFKVRCEENFYGRPESELEQIEFRFV